MKSQTHLCARVQLPVVSCAVPVHLRIETCHVSGCLSFEGGPGPVCEAPCTHIDALEPAHDQLPDLHDRGVAPIVEVRANPVQALWRAMSTQRRAWGYDQPETGHVINSTARVCARGVTPSPGP